MIFRRPSNRPSPLMATQNYKTYSVRMPRRKATCAEVNCANYTNGWQLRVEILTPELLHTAKNSGRHWNLIRIAEGETYMVFAAGQQCFEVHTVTQEREIFIAGRGDYRSFNPRRAYVHKRPDDWVDDFQTQLDKISREIQKG